MQEKNDFRKFQIEVLQNINQENQFQKLTKIKQFLFDQLEIKAAKTVAITLSHGFELPTQDLIRQLRSFGKKVFIPRTLTDYQMEFVEYNEDTILKPHHFGILEPQNGLIINPEYLDIIIVPGLAYETKQGYRLGFGGGYYDRYLKKATNAKKIVLAFKEQVYDEANWKIEAFDVTMDQIISEDGIKFEKEDE